MKKRIDHYASYKDPSAKVFLYHDEPGFVFRELTADYLPHYNHFISSGLANALLQKNYIVSFEELKQTDAVILKARKIDFVSYPYEWSFNQWMDAALLTLKIQYQALKYGMTLKDATPFNIVFDGDKPLMVDLSSFEMYEEGKPWQALKQFCENFYLPVLLGKYFDATANEIYLNNTAGINTGKGLSLLPSKAFLNINTLLYLVLPEKIRKRGDQQQAHVSNKKITSASNLQIANDLFNVIKKINQRPKKTKWNLYYEKDVASSYFEEKEQLVKEWFLNNYHHKSVIDFGCNTGNFSIAIASLVKQVIAFDEDIRSVDALYLHCKNNQIANISCLWGSVSDPAPAIGWNNQERTSLKDRLKADAGLALALIHHLAITNYISFEKMADFFADCCGELIIEFVPKTDDKVRLLLLHRKDIFQWYTLENFISAFSKRFDEQKRHLFANKRILFHFIKKQ